MRLANTKLAQKANEAYGWWLSKANLNHTASTWARLRRLDIREGGELPRATRSWLLTLILVLAATTGGRSEAKPLPDDDFKAQVARVLQIAQKY